ncbi:MAG TPA: hypothetical protein VFN35_14965 [Ktedonobacteraceae bacterium]|nr:hypothetical protein [Ktedonobacteraceae bacterium]
MNTNQQITLPLNEIRETMSNASEETMLAVQVNSPDEHVPAENANEDGISLRLFPPKFLA